MCQTLKELAVTSNDSNVPRHSVPLKIYWQIFHQISCGPAAASAPGRPCEGRMGCIFLRDAQGNSILPSMKNTLPLILFSLGLIWAGTGCVSTQESGPPPASQADVGYLREEIRRLNARLDATDAEVGRMQGDLMSSRSSQPSMASAAQLQSVKTEVDDLQRQIRAVDAARAKDKKAIYDDLTKKISKLLKSSSSSSSRSSSRRRTGSQSGIEHVVKPGQTLSQIAAAYGVTTKVLVEENGLKNANAIFAGQKLFIPD